MFKDKILFKTIYIRVEVQSFLEIRRFAPILALISSCLLFIAVGYKDFVQFPSSFPSISAPKTRLNIIAPNFLS